MSLGPDFHDLVGEDLPEQERERLRRVHDLLVAAGPPPELTPALRETPRPPAPVSALFRRRRGAALLLAAALAAAALGGAYAAGRAGRGFDTERTLAMRGTAAAPGALASLRVGGKDEAGNWPMVMSVRGLATLPRGQLYELFLTRRGKAAASCGTFVVHGGTTEVTLNAPYRLKTFDGWVVTRHDESRPESGTVLLTT